VRRHTKSSPPRRDHINQYGDGALGVDVDRVEAEAPVPVEDRDRGLGSEVS